MCADDLLSRYKAGERDFKKAGLSKAILSGEDLKQASFIGASFIEADLQVADLSNTDLSETNFYRAKLAHANLSSTKLFMARMINADLRNSNLSEADLRRVQLYKADLSDANLVGADLLLAKLAKANLLRANIDGVDLTGVTLGPDSNLLLSKWETVTVDGRKYYREAVESGEQVLPFPIGAPVRFVFESNRVLSGEEYYVARELISIFELIAKKTELILETSVTSDGSREYFTIVYRGEYREVENVGLKVLSSIQPQDEKTESVLNSAEDLNNRVEWMISAIENLLKERGCDFSAQHFSMKRKEIVRDFFSAFAPVRIEFQDGQSVGSFYMAADGAGVPLDDIHIYGTHVDFAFRKNEMLEAPQILIEILSELAGVVC